MTVYLPAGCVTYYYDFWFRGIRHAGSTLQTSKADAAHVESQVKLRLRHEAAGIATFDPANTPRFQQWANVYYAYQQKFTTRPDLVRRALDVVLEFWGAPPKRARGLPAVPRARRVAAPYLNLRLGDPIADPALILKFERWIEQRGVSGSTRNTYLSALSGLYRVALQPEYRQTSGITRNPFSDIRRSPRRGRVVALEPAQVLAWVTAAPYHIALAATIAALAPKLRLRTILELRWSEHFDSKITKITVHRHKTASAGAPQVTPVSSQLREILVDAHARSSSDHVIAYHGEALGSIKKGTRRAAIAVGLEWGIAAGVTFHTIRHSIATLLADLGLAERLRMELMGHREIRTTQQYTHLAAASQVEPHERLAAALPLRDVLIAKGEKFSAGRGKGRRLALVPKPAQKKQPAAHAREKSTRLRHGASGRSSGLRSRKR